MYIFSGKLNCILNLGLDKSSIEYDKGSLSWKLTEHQRNTTAVTDAPLSTYVMGTHEWIIENDKVACSTKGESYKRVLKLTGCKEGEFTCNDGQCIR